MVSLPEVFPEYSQSAEPYLNSFMKSPPGWLDELDFSPAPPHYRMGTRSLDLDHWFLVDEFRDSELELRRRLIAERRPRVLQVLPTAEAASAEVFDLVRDWLSAKELRPSIEPDEIDEHPLAAAGQLVQDDLCLLVLREGKWHLDGAVLCFPAVWDLNEKIGLPVAEVHAPVNHYAEELESKVDRFLDRPRVYRPAWRRNIGLKPTHSLHLAVSKNVVDSISLDVLEDGSPYWLRSERQTFRRLARSQAILFSIRTQIAPVGVLRKRPDRARDLLAMYQSWDSPMNQFKMVDSDISRRLVPWLRMVAATHAT